MTGVREAPDSDLNMKIQSKTNVGLTSNYLTECKMRLAYAQRNEREGGGPQTVRQEGHGENENKSCSEEKSLEGLKCKMR